MSQEIPEALQQQAEAVFHLIERRVAHIVAKLYMAAVMMLEQADNPSGALTITDVEYTAPHWLELVPESPEIKAILLHLLTEQYPVSETASPQTLHNLNWADPAVRAAFEQYYDQVIPENSADEPPSADSAARFFGLKWMYLKRGETLFKWDDNADRIYLLLEGLLRSDAYPNGLRRLIKPGEMIGDLNWLAKERRDSTVLALRDSDIVYLTHTDFESYVQSHPNVLRNLARGIVRQLRTVTHHTPSVVSSRSFVILPASAGVDDFIGKLVSVLERFGTLLLLTTERVRQFGHDRLDLETVVDSYEFVDWLEQQEATHDYLVYVGDVDFPNWTRRCIEQADHLLIVARATESAELSPIEIILGNIPYPELTPPVDLVLIHERRASTPTGTAEWLKRRTVNQHYHVALDYPPDYDRLVRHLRGRAIGIVFGGGGMRGLAHVGVIKALNERGIQCDVVGGTSAGAIIAACYGLGWDTDAMLKGAIEAMDRQTMFEPTLPFTAVLTANRLNKTYRAMFGDTRIEDLWTPIFTVTANLTHAKMTVKSSGSVQKAVRGSTSLAGILPPTIDENGDLLLDGGAFNNTPADVMRERVRSGTVIAVDLGYTQREFPQYDYNDQVNGFAVLWSRINPFMKPIKVPAIMDVMMRSNGMGGMNATAAQVAHADVVIRPLVTQFGLYDKEAADQIFEEGYRSGQTLIDMHIQTGGLRDTFDSQSALRGE